MFWYKNLMFQRIVLIDILKINTAIVELFKLVEDGVQWEEFLGL